MLMKLSRMRNIGFVPQIINTTETHAGRLPFGYQTALNFYFKQRPGL